MSDALGWRRKFGVLIPSTNTVVQPEYDGMRPPGVTNHVSRMRIPNIKLQQDEDFEQLVRAVAAAQNEALETVLTCEPDHLILGFSTETHRNGLEAARAMRAEIEAQTGLGVTMGGDALAAALRL